MSEQTQSFGSVHMQYSEKPDWLLRNPVSRALTAVFNGPFYIASGTADKLYSTVSKNSATQAKRIMEMYPPERDVYVDVNNTSIFGQYKRLWDLRHEKNMNPLYRLSVGSFATGMGLFFSKVMKRDWTNPFNQTITWMHPSAVEGVQKYAHMRWLFSKHPIWSSLYLQPIGGTISELHANRIARKYTKGTYLEGTDESQRILTAGATGVAFNDALQTLPYIESFLRFTPIGNSLLARYGGALTRFIPSATVGAIAGIYEWRKNKKNGNGELRKFLFSPAKQIA